MKKFQSGFTLVELIIMIAFIAVIAFIIGGGYIAVHFLAKVW